MKINKFLFAIVLCTVMQQNVIFCMEKEQAPQAQSYWQKYAPEFMQNMVRWMRGIFKSKLEWLVEENFRAMVDMARAKYEEEDLLKYKRARKRYEEITKKIRELLERGIVSEKDIVEEKEKWREKYEIYYTDVMERLGLEDLFVL